MDGVHEENKIKMPIKLPWGLCYIYDAEIKVRVLFGRATMKGDILKPLFVYNGIESSS